MLEFEIELEQFVPDRLYMNPKPNCICPLCGNPNECALAQGGSIETPCWCHGVKIDPAIIAGVPEAQRNETCICRRCAASRLPTDTEGI